jgi:uncharacterized protein (TIGR03067 family)
MRRVLPLLIVLSLGFAPAPVFREKDDLKALQGEWELVSRTFEGKPRPHEPQRIRFTGGYLAEADGSGRCEVALDTSASPKGMEMVWGAKAVEPLRLQAVYALQGDTLRICYYSTQEGRPKDLSGIGTMHFLHVFRRVKR